MNKNYKENQPTLKRTLNTFHLWGFAVGLVISGQYFGWSYGWSHAGTLGFMITAFFVALMYITFILSMAELSAAIPRSGGPFVYTYYAFGKNIAFVVAFSTLIEFLFAPPAIAMAIGSYLHNQIPVLDPKLIATITYIVFMLLNVLGIYIAASFELIITIIAIFELLVFIIVVFSSFNLDNLLAYGWAGSNSFQGFNTISGIFAAIPFAIWFFLAIEGAAMTAEEVKNPQKAIPRALTLGVFTLVLLSFGVMIFAAGVGDWRELANINDPLPQAMKIVVGASSGLFHMLIWLGVFGLIASFHGIMIGYSRHIYALAKANYLPNFLGKISYRFRTPYLATIFGGIFGIIIIYSDDLIIIGDLPLTANIVIMSAIGAIVMYVISMISLFKLRKSRPDLVRPYKAPFYPLFPIIALIGALICLITMIYYNVILSLIFFVMMILSYLFCYFTSMKSIDIG